MSKGHYTHLFNRDLANVKISFQGIISLIKNEKAIHLFSFAARAAKTEEERALLESLCEELNVDKKVLRKLS